MIGDKMKIIRKSKNITLKQLANKLDCTPQMLSQYETGKRNPKWETVVKIATALEADTLELIEVKSEEELAEMKKNGTPFYFDKTKWAKNTDTNSLSKNEIITNYNKLNNKGKKEAAKRLEELSLMPEYNDDLVKEYNAFLKKRAELQKELDERIDK